MFNNVSITSVVIVLISMLVSIPFHEAMHGYVARLLGDRTAHDAGRITLNPLKHIDILTTILLPAVLMLMHIPPIFIAKPVPFDPRNVKYEEFGAALVGLAGPVSNLLLASVAAVIFRVFGAGTDLMQNVFATFIQVNVLLFVFNLIPIPPLDGSRLVYAFAPEPVQRIMYQLETSNLGFILLAILVFSGTLGPIISNVSNTIFNFLV